MLSFPAKHQKSISVSRRDLSYLFDEAQIRPTRDLQDKVHLPDQQDQPRPSHDPYIGPCESRTDRLGLPRDVDRPIVRLSLEVGELQVKAQMKVSKTNELPLRGKMVVLTVHRETASLCLAAETATRAAPQAKMDVKAKALTHAYVRKVRTCSCGGLNKKTSVKSFIDQRGRPELDPLLPLPAAPQREAPTAEPSGSKGRPEESTNPIDSKEPDQLNGGYDETQRR